MMDLIELAELCENASGPDRNLDYAIFCEIAPKERSSHWHPIDGNQFTSSLDAAKMLVPEGFDWAVFRTNDGLTIHAWCGSREDVFGETVELALCAAALRARATP